MAEMPRFGGAFFCLPIALKPALSRRVDFFSGELVTHGFQIATDGSDVSLELIQSLLENEPATTPALQLVSNPPGLMLEFRQRLRQCALLAFQSRDDVLVSHCGSNHNDWPTSSNVFRATCLSNTGIKINCDTLVSTAPGRCTRIGQCPLSGPRLDAAGNGSRSITR